MKKHARSYCNQPRLLFLALAILAASLSAAHSNRLLAQSPTSAPSIRTVSLSDAVDLNQLQTGNRETNLTDKLTKPQAAQTIYFGEVDEYADADQEPVATLPVIALHNATSWTALPLVGEGLQNVAWKYVGAGPAPKEIWGALDTAVGASRPTFVLAHSTDGGATFGLSVFHKPCKLGQFFDFVMNREGRGRASVSLSADCGPHKAGIYHFETNDDGRTWSAEPRYEPDAMIRADEVPDDEQPDDAPMSSKTLLRVHPRAHIAIPGGFAFEMKANRSIVARVCNPCELANSVRDLGILGLLPIESRTHGLQTRATVGHPSKTLNLAALKI